MVGSRVGMYVAFKKTMSQRGCSVLCRDDDRGYLLYIFNLIDGTKDLGGMHFSSCYFKRMVEGEHLPICTQ